MSLIAEGSRGKSQFLPSRRLDLSTSLTNAGASFGEKERTPLTRVQPTFQ
jgi:hypothetical protein